MGRERQEKGRGRFPLTVNSWLRLWSTPLSGLLCYWQKLLQYNGASLSALQSVGPKQTLSVNHMTVRNSRWLAGK